MENGTFCGVTGIALLVGETIGLLVGVTETDGGCVAFTEIGTFPRDIDIASGKNDFCDVTIDVTALLDDDDEDMPLLVDDVELDDGEWVFVIVKLGVMFMLAGELDKVAAKMSA